ncbi:MAG: GDSL family lipase [Parasporobacterium sp.]|nr:GDSL family lipase [Parasporobacterium sp.]
MKKRILCFGDSLTWGFSPEFGIRYDENTRWTGVLANELGNDYVIIEEGQNGRTIATDDLPKGERNGLKYIQACMESHRPFDMIIIMLGTNDIKKKFGYCAMDIADEMSLLLEKVCAFNNFRQEGKAKIVLMSPPLFGKKPDSIYADPCYDYEEARKITKELAEFYKQLAYKFSCDYINAALYANADDSIDGYHLSGKEQTKLGLAIADIIKRDFTI